MVPAVKTIFKDLILTKVLVLLVVHALPFALSSLFYTILPDACIYAAHLPALPPVLS